jgi:uncharacterized membrane protein YtjA (UPF0391 family)
MPTLALTCLAISMIAAVLGVGGMSGPVGTVAELLFLVFAALFVVAVVFGGGHRPARSRSLGTRRTAATANASRTFVGKDML